MYKKFQNYLIKIKKKILIKIKPLKLTLENTKNLKKYNKYFNTN